jgi:hypothetical protein
MISETRPPVEYKISRSATSRSAFTLLKEAEALINVVTSSIVRAFGNLRAIRWDAISPVGRLRENSRAQYKRNDFTVEFILLILDGANDRSRRETSKATRVSAVIDSIDLLSS